MNPLTDQMTKCESCPRKCRVNRLQGETGFCRIGANAQISHVGLHFGEEPPISGTNGSGTIFFAGCNLRCAFCQNYQISQEFQHGTTQTMTTDELAAAMLRLQERGAHNINFVSPSHVIFQIADAIIAAKEKGLVVPVVYNSNGYDSVDALRQIRGLVDIYMPDIKYMNNELARRLSAADDYADIIPGVLAEMLDQVDHLEMDARGIAVRGLLLRHLVLPGHLDNSCKCLQFLADLSPYIFVSIMSQYSPQYKACDYPEINRTLRRDEYDQITDYALDLGLENAFIQHLASHDHYLPDFARKHPFNSASSGRRGGKRERFDRDVVK
ncbi:radical SAM protein [candidate division KSB1 bacterium]|nr:radical SAM protein [candidate division KSB1 bacterium]